MSLSGLTQSGPNPKDKTGILTFQELFSKANFQIPGYQRDYAWAQTQADDFLDDLVHTGKKQQFFGTILLTGSSPYEVVDGQQRITTAFLLFLAMIDHVNSIVSPSASELQMLNLAQQLGKAQQIDFPRGHLCDKLATSGDRMKIAESVVENAFAGTSDFNVARNYLAFRSKLNLLTGAEFGYLAKALTSNALIVVVLIYDYSAAIQMYESVNTKGLSLTEGDKVKSKIYAKYTDNSSRTQEVKDFVATWARVLHYFEDCAREVNNFPSLSEIVHYYSMLFLNEYTKYYKVYGAISDSILTQAQARDYLFGLEKTLEALRNAVMSTSNRLPDLHLRIAIHRVASLANHFAFLWLVASAQQGCSSAVMLTALETGETFAFRERLVSKRLTQEKYQNEVFRFASKIRSGGLPKSSKVQIVQEGVSDRIFLDELFSRWADSTGQRNEFSEFLFRHHITECLARTSVETPLDLGEISRREF